MGYLDFVDLFLEEELGLREGRRFRNALKLSGLPHRKTLEGFDFAFPPDLDVRKVRDLATREFVRTKSNIALLGPGVGKTMLAVALALDRRGIASSAATETTAPRPSGGRCRHRGDARRRRSARGLVTPCGARCRPRGGRPPGSDGDSGACDAAVGGTPALPVRCPRCVVIGALALQQVLTTPTDGLVLLLAGMIAAYSSSAFASLRRAAMAGLVILSGAALMSKDAGDWAFIAIVVGGAWLVGLIVMQRSTELWRVREDKQALSTRLAEAAEMLARAQRQLASGPAPEQLAALTARELEVARAIARGMTNAEIAAALFISEWTVKSHVASVLRKLSLRDRAQVVVAAYEAGLVTPHSGRLNTDLVSRRPELLAR